MERTFKKQNNGLWLLEYRKAGTWYRVTGKTLSALKRLWKEIKATAKAENAQ